MLQITVLFVKKIMTLKMEFKVYVYFMCLYRIRLKIRILVLMIFRIQVEKPEDCTMEQDLGSVR